MQLTLLIPLDPQRRGFPFAKVAQLSDGPTRNQSSASESGVCGKASAPGLWATRARPIRQIWSLLLVSLLLAFVAGVGVNVSSTRDALQDQLRLQNSDNATALAQVLSQLKGQRELMERAVVAQFDSGFYRRIRFIGVDANLLFERESQAKA